MKLKYFGDSYDIVKKSLLAWLSEFGPWVTHPMFTDSFGQEDAEAFSRMLKTPLLSVEVLTTKTNREDYFSGCRAADNLFLDPDTGVRLEPCHGKNSEKYVFGHELIDWCIRRPKALTLVFDQSYSRGLKKDILVQKKLRYFADEEIFGFVYDSHATFLLVSADAELVERARERLLEVSGLPEFRLVLRKSGLFEITNCDLKD
jgi:hypothetical protein